MNIDIYMYCTMKLLRKQAHPIYILRISIEDNGFSITRSFCEDIKSDSLGYKYICTWMDVIEE